MKTKKIISPCFWFNTEAEDAANFYVSIFPNSKLKVLVILQKNDLKSTVKKREVD